MEGAAGETARTTIRRKSVDVAGHRSQPAASTLDERRIANLKRSAAVLRHCSEPYEENLGPGQQAASAVARILVSARPLRYEHRAGNSNYPSDPTNARKKRNLGRRSHRPCGRRAGHRMTEQKRERFLQQRLTVQPTSQAT